MYTVRFIKGIAMRRTILLIILYPSLLITLVGTVSLAAQGQYGYAVSVGYAFVSITQEVLES